MFLLRAYMPERFRHAHKSVRHADEEPTPAVEPLGQALLRLEPVAPEQPHLLMPPDDLETELQCAHILNGVLPRWYRGRDEISPPEEAVLGKEFERALEAAKRAAAGLPPLDDREEPEDSGGADGFDDERFLG